MADNCCCGNNNAGREMVKMAERWLEGAGGHITRTVRIHLCGGEMLKVKRLKLNEYSFSSHKKKGYREFEKTDIPYSRVVKIIRYETAE